MVKENEKCDAKMEKTSSKPSLRSRVNIIRPISPVVLRNKLMAFKIRPQSAGASSTSSRGHPIPSPVISPEHRQTWNPSCTNMSGALSEATVNQPAIHIRFRGKVHASEKVWSGTQPTDLPNFALRSPEGPIFSAVTGPDSGLVFVDDIIKTGEETHPFCNVKRSSSSSFWTRFSSRKCDGCSQSLYDKHPFTGNVTGDPNADAYFAVARSNCFLLGIADGVNWGEHSRLASRAALNGCWSHVQPILFPMSDEFDDIFNDRESPICQSSNVFGASMASRSSISTPTSSQHNTPSAETIRSQISQPPKDTEAAFQLLLDALWSAQDRVIEQTHIGFTTFCLVLILPLAPPSRQFAACSINVGDSLAFLLSKYHGVREMTSASHVGPDEARNIRDTGGALGAVNEDYSPALHNLTCSLTLCDPGDLVFLTTDGISDNFDPVVMRWATKPCPILPYIDETDDEDREFSTQSTNVAYDPMKSTLPLSTSSLYSKGEYNKESSSVNNCTNSSSSLNGTVPDNLRATELCFVELLQLTGQERRQYGLKEMERLWHEAELLSTEQEYSISAREFCQTLQREVKQRTQRRRDIIEDRKLYRGKLTPMERQSLHATVQQKLRFMPGKLDHATIVACEIGRYRGNEYEAYEDTTSLLSSSFCNSSTI